MSDEQLRTDEDVEAILRLAVQQSSTSTEDLRSRLTMSAAELGISEEQLLRAESEYFREKEAARLREEREAKDKIVREQERKGRLWRVFGGIGAAAAVVGVIALMNTGAFRGGSFFMIIIPLMVFKAVRPNRHRRGS